MVSRLSLLSRLPRPARQRPRPRRAPNSGAEKSHASKLRTVLLLALSAALAASASAAAYVYRLPAAATQPVPALDYRHQARIDYRVRLKPNGFYPTGTLGPGQAYLAAFVQEIDASLAYRFSAAEKVSLKGTSGVTATVEALTSERDQPLRVWERSFTLTPPKEFRHEGRIFELMERITVDPNGYAQLVQAHDMQAGNWAPRSSQQLGSCQWY